MKKILVVISIALIFNGCTQSTSDIGDVRKVELAPGEIYFKHNADACPKDFLGEYQKEDITDASQMTLKFTTLTDGVLMAQFRIPKTETGLSINDPYTLLADGVKRKISSINAEDFRISYCENFKIFSFGKWLGVPFQQSLSSNNDGIELLSTSGDEKPYVTKFKKVIR